MKLTPFEQLILDTADYLDKIGLDFILDGSTQLGAMREKRAIPWDREVNFSVAGDDLTDELIEKFKKDYQYVDVMRCDEKYGAIYLIQAPQTVPRWEVEPGIVLLSPFWTDTKQCYFNIVSNFCHVYPLEFADKSKWEDIEFLGRTFKVAPNPEKMMELYFGPDWRIPNPDWHWGQNSKNQKYHEEL